MSFAKTYLNRYATGQVLNLPAPDQNLDLIIIIPVYNEPDILKCLDSLLSAEPPGISWEIILIINESTESPPEHHNQNVITEIEVVNYRNNLSRSDIKIHIINPEPFSRKKAGPGIARKTAMDEAVRRFNLLGRPGGVVASFDADTTCRSDYLKELSSFFQINQGAAGCTIYFEHPLDDGLITNDRHREAIIQYELYMRYFKMSLDWIEYPYSCYSLGSAFAVRAATYVKAGGMGLQQAGEDFYFLQKCIPLGDFWELNTTAVFPSSRTSDRVVFGTGPFISRYISDHCQELEVFPFELLKSVKPIFKWINSLDALPSSVDEADNLIQSLPGKVRSQIIKLNWSEKIQDAYRESAGLEPFVKRCYHQISLLQIIRLFNEVIESGFNKLPVAGEFVKMMNEMDESVRVQVKDDALGLLLTARELERSKGNVLIN